MTINIIEDTVDSAYVQARIDATDNHTDSSGNTFVGDKTFEANTTGSFNTALGYYGLYDNTEGSQNTAVGTYTLTQNITGIDNTTVGYLGLNGNETGSYNTAVGSNASRSQKIGDGNTSLGWNALHNTDEADQNTAVGAMAGYAVFGNNNTLVGYAAEPSDPNVNNEITLGNADVEKFRIPGIGLEADSSGITIDGQAIGGGTETGVYREHQNASTEDQTITSDHNAIACGPIQLDHVVTIEDGAVWVII
jgi:hypothetical protein